MKSRPILFSAPMVRALLDGSKTQTRRALRVQPYSVTTVASGKHIFDFRMDMDDFSGVVGMEEMLKRCPYGQPGDQLWVRESWRTTGDDGRADYLPPRDIQKHEVWYEADGEAHWRTLVGKLRPSMFMPSWASRITLEVTGVRVERLQDISEADAIAEGCEPNCLPNRAYEDEPYKSGYVSLWQGINGHGSWAANPWVWVVEFKAVQS